MGEVGVWVKKGKNETGNEGEGEDLGFGRVVEFVLRS